MRVKSFAKINLGIEILGKREDGYHEIRTLLQTVGLYDVLEFHPLSQDVLILEGDDNTIPWDERNLIHRAAVLLKERFNLKKGVRILARKTIPPGSGLGGGSSNAAITLLALNEIWGIGLKKKDLMETAVLLGADVPFFLEGGLCLGQGKGDRVFPLKDLEPFFCVLVIPPFPISTATVYGQRPSSLTSQGKDSKIIRFLNSREIGFLENELEETIFRLHPQIKGIKNLIQEQGSELSLASGSGSAVFGLFSERRKAEIAVEAIDRDHRTILVETVRRTDCWKEWHSGV
jgi:4-diphosphocytidyl-2-C-methyl-D-erythritol kinase